MDTYSLLREIADSWVLLAMFTFFLACIVWVMRPGSKDTYAQISAIPLREDCPKTGSDAGTSRTAERLDFVGDDDNA